MALHQKGDSFAVMRSKSKSDEELKGIIKNKIGQPENETQTKK